MSRLISRPTFRPLKDLGVATTCFLWANVAYEIVATGSAFAQSRLLARAAREGITVAEANSNDARQALIGMFGLLLLALTAAVFLPWFYRAHKNLRALGTRNPQYGSGWTIGGFFVPFLNLVRPIEVMNEVWRGSDPSGVDPDADPRGKGRRRRRKGSSMVLWWWLLYLASGILNFMSLRAGSGRDVTIDALQWSTNFLMLSGVATAASAFLAVRVVAQITRRQPVRMKRVIEAAEAESDADAEGQADAAEADETG